MEQEKHASFDYSVVIPTMNRHGEAIASASQLLGQTLLPRRVVVVDASTEPLQAPVDASRAFADAGVELMVVHHRPSTSAQRNYGADQIETPLVLFMDDDMKVPPDYVEALVERWAVHGFATLGGAVGGMDGAFEAPGRLNRLFRTAFMLHLYDQKALTTTFRTSQKLRFTRPRTEVTLPATSTAAVLYRTDMARKHRFEERFGGYVLGEDIDMSARLARDRPILYVPSVRSIHEGGPAQLRSHERWYHRGRYEAYFRLRRLDPGPVAAAAFALSVCGEAIGAGIDSLRDRDPHHLMLFLRGLRETLGDVRRERRQHFKLRPKSYYALNHVYRRTRILGLGRHEQRRDSEGIRILGYHRITDKPDVLGVKPASFREQLLWTLDQGLQPLRLSEALSLLAQPVEGRWFCVTFDDGYLDNLTDALPVLMELGVPATIFVPTAIIDRTASYSWYREPPEALTWDDLRELLETRIIDVQSHTKTHRSLSRLSDEETRDELEGSKQRLEQQLGRPITSLAFPAGVYDGRTIEFARSAGYRSTLTTLPGLNPGGRSLYELRRTMLLTGDTLKDFKAKMNGLLDEPSRLERFVWTRRSRPH